MSTNDEDALEQRSEERLARPFDREWGVQTLVVLVGLPCVALIATLLFAMPSLSVLLIAAVIASITVLPLSWIIYRRYRPDPALRELLETQHEIKEERRERSLVAKQQVKLLEAKRDETAGRLTLSEGEDGQAGELAIADGEGKLSVSKD